MTRYGLTVDATVGGKVEAHAPRLMSSAAAKEPGSSWRMPISRKWSRRAVGHVPALCELYLEGLKHGGDRIGVRQPLPVGPAVVK